MGTRFLMRPSNETSFLNSYSSRHEILSVRASTSLDPTSDRVFQHNRPITTRTALAKTALVSKADVLSYARPELFTQ